MNLSNVLAMSAMMCVSVFSVGCDAEIDGQFDDQIEQNGSLIDQEQEEGLVLGGILPGGELGDATVVGVETVDVTIPGSLHAQGLALPAKLVRPKWSSTVGKRPAMLVLHGSGGLLKMPEKGDPLCSSKMETQFVDWSNRLAKLGYTVLLPSSYSARGFCDLHEDTGRIPKTFNDKEEQVIARLYDTDAAARYLCARSEVDCERMGLLGFSQGATAVMTALHWQIDHAIAYFRDNKSGSVDFPIVDVKPGRPEFQMGIAYYPGCGFDGLVPLSTSSGAAIENKYTATAPLTILHGSADDLVTQCSTQYGAGARQIHSKQVAAALKVSDIYQVTVYSGAHHSFDSASSTGADATARDAALKVTLAKLATQL
jgi:dienelactone hydrolase